MSMRQLSQTSAWSFSLLILTSSWAVGDDKSISFSELQGKIDRQVQDWRPTAEEKRFDQIGWRTSLLEAEKLAHEHQRPIFLFTQDGRMNVGRC